MNPDVERIRELGALIRAAHADLGKLQLRLIEAHARQFNPAELGIQIANLGRQMARWKREQETLFRQIVLDGAAESESPVYCSLILDRLNARPHRPQGTRQTDPRAAHSTGFGDKAELLICTS